MRQPRPVAARGQAAALIFQAWGVYLGLLVLLVISAVISPQSFKVQDLLNLAKQASALGIVSIGQTLVILTGGIDLSVGSVITFVHVFSVGTIMGRPEMVLPIGALCLLLGTVAGMINGIGITRARISPFVMTLCMDFIVRGFYMIYTKGQPRGVVPDNLRFIGRGRVLEVVPIAAIVWIALSLAFVFMLRRTILGARLYAVGAQVPAAHLRFL